MTREAWKDQPPTIPSDFKERTNDEAVSGARDKT